MNRYFSQFACCFRWSLLFLSINFLSACHHSYTVKQSEVYARQIGLINQFEISRWHNRVLAQNSSLLIASRGVTLI